MLRLIVLTSALVLQARSDLVQGSVVVPANQIVFLHKFCIDSDPDGRTVGVMSAQLRSGTGGDLKLAVFDDEAESLPDPGHIDWGLQCSSDKLKRVTRGLFHVDGRSLHASRGFQREQAIIEKLRPRWWYFAVVDCSGEDRVLEYSLHLTNPRLGWQRELSMDQCGLVAMGLLCLSGACGLYFAVLSVQVYVSVRGNCDSTKHPLRVCLLGSISVAAVGALLQLLNANTIAQHGSQLQLLYVAGKLSKWTSKLLLICAIMLISRGHAISHPLQKRHVIGACSLLAPLFVGCFILDLNGEYAQYRKYTNDSLFCSRYGAVLVLLDVGLLTVYAHNLRRSFTSETDTVKRRFFATWGPMYGIAFGILPVAVIVGSTDFVSPWVQVRVVHLLTNAVHICLLAILVKSLWPEKSLPAFCLDDQGLAETIGLKVDLLPTLLHKQAVEATAIHKPDKLDILSQLQV
ncbi:unnamed protein product [Prorocentrum cordatum]|uniref:GPR180/TMEM145 transmembrane domain-containing protein n=1 Tax=Prorocentrum cordatum TaxID=2364126 RepID=A0ABN9U1S1_9DINO|nr:unnamed protein product [Polarella glacialis]